MNGKLSVVMAQYNEMESVTVQCNAGYGVIGSSNITCSENRTWHPEVPKCEWVSCTIQGILCCPLLSVMTPPPPQSSIPARSSDFVQNCLDHSEQPSVSTLWPSGEWQVVGFSAFTRNQEMLRSLEGRVYWSSSSQPDLPWSVQDPALCVDV